MEKDMVVKADDMKLLETPEDVLSISGRILH